MSDFPSEDEEIVEEEGIDEPEAFKCEWCLDSGYVDAVYTTEKVKCTACS